ncbi:hypothetical protein [Pararhodobacter aggregans]|uniref:Uncharacterized protein n=1 Tax=Pararhodobacter aggregans TaxID=404875 RepID=A0A2T7UMR2_9RHOB|nr:hypothetical protein [Pararhodobacter aggregans]PVE45964.1 hypothetical protein DDE23_19330 [Pararhodobacter aggregans]
MTRHLDPDSLPLRPPSDAPQERLCLRCRVPFPSEGFGERICRRCKGSSSWRSSVQFAPSTGRQR